MVWITGIYKSILLPILLFNLIPLNRRKENIMQINKDINSKSEKIQQLENKVNFILATLGIAGIVWLLSE